MNSSVSEIPTSRNKTTSHPSPATPSFTYSKISSSLPLLYHNLIVLATNSPFPLSASKMPSTAAYLLSLSSLPYLIQASLGFDCSNIVSQKVKWNLKPLEGPRAVHWDIPGTPASHNYTFTLDICKPLRKFKDLPGADQCAAQTRGMFIVYFPTRSGRRCELENVAWNSITDESSWARQLTEDYSMRYRARR